MGEFHVRTYCMFAYRDVLVRCHPAWAGLIKDKKVIGTSDGATRSEIERDIDRLLDGGRE